MMVFESIVCLALTTLVIARAIDVLDHMAAPEWVLAQSPG